MFVKQFYYVLGSTPGILFRFYTDSSYYTYADENGVSVTMHGQKVKLCTNTLLEK